MVVLHLISAAPTLALKKGIFSTPMDEALIPAACFPKRKRASLMATGPFQSYCSPYRNAEQTAHWLEVASISTNILAECSYGAWSGIPLKTIADQHSGDYQKWLQQSDFTPPQGESLLHAQQRAIQWIHTLTMDFTSQQTIMAITHPTIIRGLLCEVLQCPLSPNFPIDIAPLTVSSLIHWRKWRIHQVSTPLL